jgi:hypothetical protein
MSYATYLTRNGMVQQSVYPLHQVIHTFSRLRAPNVSVEPSQDPWTSITSPLQPLLAPLLALTQRHRKHLSPLLPSLVAPSSSSFTPNPPLDLLGSNVSREEWYAMRIGLGIWLGSRGLLGDSKERKRGEPRSEMDLDGQAEGDRTAREEGMDEEKRKEKEEEERKRETKLVIEGEKWLQEIERRELVAFLPARDRCDGC